MISYELTRQLWRMRAERNQLRESVRNLSAENTRLLATNHQLSATVRRMDATNAVLTDAARARDFHPHGGFDPSDGAA